MRFVKVLKFFFYQSDYVEIKVRKSKLFTKSKISTPTANPLKPNGYQCFLLKELSPMIQWFTTTIRLVRYHLTLQWSDDFFSVTLYKSVSIRFLCSTSYDHDASQIILVVSQQIDKGINSPCNVYGYRTNRTNSTVCSLPSLTCLKWNYTLPSMNETCPIK